MRRLISVLAFVLALGGNLWGEPKMRKLAVTETSDTWSLPANTRSVAIVSNSGSDTCRFRLFTNRDTPAAATMVDPSVEILAGEYLGFSIKRSTTQVGGDTEGDASFYRAISAVCGAGDTATLRVFYK